MLLVGPFVAAWSADIPPDAAEKGASQASHLPELASHPPLDPVQRAMNGTNLTDLSFTVEVRWGADGRVISARVLEHTSSGVVESAALEWARQLRFESKTPGRGLIPFKLHNANPGARHPAPPPSRPHPGISGLQSPAEVIA